jgi:hypothetical protein
MILEHPDGWVLLVGGIVFKKWVVTWGDFVTLGYQIINCRLIDLSLHCYVKKWSCDSFIIMLSLGIVYLRGFEEENIGSK